VVFAALLELTDAAWATALRPLAQRFRRFLPVSLVLYVALFVLARAFSWFDACALAATYIAAFWFCLTSEGLAPRRPTRVRAAIALLIVYPVSFSVIAIDGIMSLEPAWTSTLFPAYVLTANVYAGIAAVAIAAPGNRSASRDLAAVLLGCALMWMYFVWSQFIVIWYGNLPDETGWVIERVAGHWRVLAWIVLITRCALPVAMLLTTTGRRPLPLAALAAIIVAGFWIECWLLVGPPLPGSVAFGSAAAVTSGFAVLFAASTLLPMPRRPPPVPNPQSAPPHGAVDRG
jgi:hypothetical protein